MRSAAVALLLALPACLDDLPEPTEFSAHLVVAADPGLELCAGTLAHMDEFVARLSAAFSLDPPTGADRFTIYWLDAEGFHERSGCPEEAYACARPDEHFTPGLPINHELVHNVAAQIGRPPPLFTEGVAVAFEGLGDAGVWAARRPGDVRELVGLTTSVQLVRAGGYPTAGAFTTFLIERHGLDAYLRVYAAMGWRESPRGMDIIFRDEFGVGLDDSIAAFEAESASSDCTELERDAKLLECAAPELEWDGDRLVHHRSLACDQDDAVGPYAGGNVVVFRTVEIPEDGDYIVHVLGDHPDNRVSLQPCTICDGRGTWVDLVYSPRVIPLAAGRYSLRIHGPVGARTSVGLRIERAPGPAAGL